MGAQIMPIGNSLMQSTIRPAVCKRQTCFLPAGHGSCNRSTWELGPWSPPRGILPLINEMLSLTGHGAP